MALEMRLTQKLTQQLLMTPQLQQAIKLLQLGRLEYIEALEKELLENPVLEKEPEDQEGGEGEDKGEIALSEASNAENPGELPPAAKESPMEWADYLESFSDSRGVAYPKGLIDYDDFPSIENTSQVGESLAEHLMFQLRMKDLSELQNLIAMQIIWNLDADGYLCLDYGEIAQECKCKEEEVEEVAVMIQHMDPIGVASRSLQECLYIQLEDLGLGDSLAARIVCNHLKELADRKYDKIAKSEGVAVEDVYDAVKAIQSLEPKPGRPFGKEPPSYVVPDVYVYKDGDDYVISLNEDGLPRLRVSPYYLEILRSEDSGEESKAYLSEKLKAATWLIKSMHQRQRTIYRVAESIVKHQREFFEEGIEKLKPMVLKDIAEDIGVHESTVSRVTTNKYMHTPHGVFELKFFFSSGVKGEGGSVSSSSVKEKIKNLIAGESPTDPISDQKIVDLLKAQGIKIARRTVAKYRESLGIPASSKRKKLF